MLSKELIGEPIRLTIFGKEFIGRIIEVMAPEGETKDESGGKVLGEPYACRAQLFGPGIKIEEQFLTEIDLAEGDFEIVSEDD